METALYNPATLFDLEEVAKLQHNNHYGSAIFPFSLAITQDLEALPDFKTSKYLGLTHIFSKNVNNQHTQWGDNGYGIKSENRSNYFHSPYFFLITKNRNQEQNGNIWIPSDKLKAIAETVTEIHFLKNSVQSRHYYYSNFHGNLAIKIKYNDQEFYIITSVEFAEIVFGLELTPEFTLKISNGIQCEFQNTCSFFLRNLNYYDRNYKTINLFDFTYETVIAAQAKLSFNDKNTETLVKLLVETKWEVPEVKKLDGIKKTWTNLQPHLADLMARDPVAFCSCRSLAGMSSKAVDGVKISSIFNEIFSSIKTTDELKVALSGFYEKNASVDDAIRKMPLFKEKRKAVLKSQGNRAFTKIQEESENLTIDKTKHKKTWAAIESGELPVGTFFRKSEQYFLLNDNWDLWEEMFKRGFHKQAIELANEVKGRTTYEKDLMSYFYFVLYALPEYLKKQTGKKWNCIPKLVNSSEELEPPKEGEDGVARSRSALTPIADNDALTVEVPYASLAIYGGRGTTYCYSHDYHVLTRGFSFHGYAVTKDVEEKLNGRDNYGLMFYTLTGSDQGRGYPTFLIIFEKRDRFGDVRVHFHRTHPFRSKDGDYNPIHNWIAGCYNWMAGNIKATNIKAQQGDLFFVQVNTDEAQVFDGKVVKNLDFSFKVNQYDKHCFEREIPFAEYTKAAKSNILGYVQLESETWLKHTEHDDVLIPAGTYAIHQCRSWEANPKGVWSLRID